MCSPLKGFLLIAPLKQPETRKDFDFVSVVCSLSLRCDAHRGDHFVIEYLGEIETEFKNFWCCLPGAQMSSNHEKIGVEDLLTHSL